MSAAYAPELKLPSAETGQINVTEMTPSQVASPKVSILPGSVTFSSDYHTEGHRRESMRVNKITNFTDVLFGNHVREAVSIFKDWLGE